MFGGLDLGNLLVHLRADDSHFNSVLSKATTTLTRWGKRAAIATSGYLTASTKAFASFEEQLANVSTMLDEQTMKYMPAYEKALKSMAVEFGEGTATLSKGLYDILSASVAPSEALRVLSVSAKAAKAGLTTTAVAADAITTVLNSYGMEAKEASRVSDVLFATVKKGKTTFAELAPTMGKVLAIASTAGLSFEEVSAALATMTRGGLDAALATTSLRSILNSFLKPTDDARAAAAAFSLGLSSATLKAEGLTGVMKRLSGATAEQLVAIVPNTRGIAGLATVFKQSAKHLEDFKFILEQTGLTQTAYEKMTDNLAHTMRRFWQAIKIISVEVGERLAPSLKSMAESFISNRYVISSWAQAFADRVVFVKEILMAFVTNFRDNWLPTLRYVFDASIVMFMAFGKQLKVLGTIAAEQFSTAFADKIARFYVDFSEKSFWQKVKSPFASMMALQFSPIATAIMEHSERVKLGATNLRESMEEIAKSTNLAMSSLTQPDFKGDFGAAFDNLARKDFFRRLADGIREVQDGLSPITNVLNTWKNKVKDVADSFLKVEEAADGLTANVTEAVEVSMTLADAYRDIRGNMGRMTQEVYDAELKALNKLRRVYQGVGVDAQALTAWYREQVTILEIDLLRASGKWADGFRAAGMQIKREMQSLGEQAYEFSLTLKDSLAAGLENSMRDFDNWKDHLMNMFEEIYWSAVRIAFIRPVAEGLATGFTAAASAALGGGATGPNVTNPQYQYGPSQAAPRRFASGGIAWEPQLAHVAENEPELITPFSQLKNVFGGGNIKIEMHNEGTNQQITKTESYIVSDQRIIDVWTRDAEGGGKTARVVRQVTKRQ